MLRGRNGRERKMEWKGRDEEGGELKELGDK